MTNERFSALFGEPVRAPDQLLTDFHMDVAASIQAVLDEAVLRLTRSLAKKTGVKNLCLAGGVALNCIANGKVLRDGAFENVWIQATLAGPWVRRSPPSTSSRASRATPMVAMACLVHSWAPAFPNLILNKGSLQPVQILRR